MEMVMVAAMVAGVAFAMRWTFVMMAAHAVHNFAGDGGFDFMVYA